MQACLFSLYLNIRLFRFVHSLHEVQRGVSIHASSCGTGAGTSTLQPASGAATRSAMDGSAAGNSVSVDDGLRDSSIRFRFSDSQACLASSSARRVWELLIPPNSCKR